MNTLEAFCVAESLLKECVRTGWESAGFTRVKTKVRPSSLVKGRVDIRVTGVFPLANGLYEQGSCAMCMDTDQLNYKGCHETKDYLKEVGLKLIKKHQNA